MRLVSASEAVSVVRSGDRVYVHCAAATPSVLLDALVARADELHDVTVVHLHTEGPGPHLASEMDGHFRHRALFVGPNARKAVSEGRADLRPGLPVGYPAAVREPGTPARRGARPYVHANPKIGDVETRIGAHVAELVPDRATLQLGIGAIPSATALALTDKKDLGIHTEMFTDAVVDLVEAGVVTGAAKERNRGKIVTTFLMGSPRLYAFVDDNPMVEMRAVDFTNDTHVIRSFSRMVSINSAIEVDLTGQVVADSIGHTVYSGVGGQMDFIRGAALAPEGRSIIALPSTAVKGATSRIVSHLQEGAGVVTTRAHVRTVVTEWGVAELFGLSLRERARALIAIAHPDYRADLRREADRLRL